MNMNIRNVDGPPSRFKYDWSEIVQYGHENPGQWFEPDRVFKHSTYAALRRGKNSLFPPSEWDIRSYATDWSEYADQIRRVRLRFQYNGKRK